MSRLQLQAGYSEISRSIEEGTDMSMVDVSSSTLHQMNAASWSTIRFLRASGFICAYRVSFYKHMKDGGADGKGHFFFTPAESRMTEHMRAIFKPECWSTEVRDLQQQLDELWWHTQLRFISREDFMQGLRTLMPELERVFKRDRLQVRRGGGIDAGNVTVQSSPHSHCCSLLLVLLLVCLLAVLYC